jgi:hypothetical protein
MASIQQSKVLRVGLIQDGRIIEERYLKRGDFSVGQDKKNTLVLPLPGVPESLVLFEHKGGQVSLLLDEQVQGRLLLEGKAYDFQQARSLGQERGGVVVLALSDGARGEVPLGPVRLFFQVTSEPMEPVRPELPPSIRGSPWQSMDRQFLVILAGSLLLNFSLASLIIASERPPDPELELDQLDDRFARVLIPVKENEPAKEPVVVEATGPKEDKPTKGEDKPEDIPAASPGDEVAAKNRREAIAKKVANKGLLKILGSAGGGGGGGAFADVLGGSTGGGDIAAALAGSTGGGVGVAGADSVGSGGPRGGGSGTVAGIGELGTRGGGGVDLGEKREVAAKPAEVGTGPVEVDSSEVDKGALTKFIKARLGAIRSCYEKELKRNPNLKGKITVGFTIQPNGRTSDIEIEENTLGNDTVASCIKTVVRGWTLPFKPEDAVPVTYPFLLSPAG